MRSRRSSRRSAEVYLTPLIDTIFVLLIVVLIAAPVAHHALRVSLPYGILREHANVPDEAYVVIFPDGKLQVRGQAEAGDIDTALALLLRYKDQHPYEYVVVYADEQASFGAVASIVDRIKRETGVHRVVFKTQQSRH